MDSKLPGLSTNALHLKFEKPTVSEYLHKLTHKEKVQDKNVEMFCKVVWDAYACMSDDERNRLLKGLIDRSSANQIQFVKTRLAMTACNSGSSELYMVQKHVLLARFNVKQKYQLMKKANGSHANIPAAEKKEKRYEACSDLASLIISLPLKKASAKEKIPDISSSLYSRLLNLRYDHERLIDHLNAAGPQSQKIFIQLLSKRCQKIEHLIENFHRIMLTGDDEAAMAVIVESAAKLLSAKSVTIYGKDDQLNCFHVKFSTWRKKRERLSYAQVLGMSCLYSRPC